MAFHVACPLTCRKICFCSYGTPAPLLAPGGRESFLRDVLDLQKLLSNPACLAAGGEDTVEILVPRLAKDLKPKKVKSTGAESGEDAPVSLSKKAVMRKKATMAAIAVAEAAALAEQAKKVAEAARLGAARQHNESGDGNTGGVTCEICFFSEVVGKRADRMIPCPSCRKMFHRNCIKRWAANRDLINWSAWVCGSCRICEVCRRTGDPNKLMFCKRCDAAVHSYCQQPPLKQVPKGPYLCSKHTICHSCSSRVPGSGVSSRWFLEYLFCDACGRLFMKGKYCTVCLKVYRDSEASPMVCCDNCEHWVHAHCDGISDEKYQEFQLDNNLHYTCAACRGDCRKIKDIDDATQEIWRRKDESEKDLIQKYQAAAGLPPTEENLRFCPSDDDEGADSRQVKRTVKLHISKGKEPDVKPHKKVESGKHKTDTGDTVGSSGGVIKKLKITLPKMHTDKAQHQQTDQKGYIGERGAGSAENSVKNKNESVVKMTKYVIQARGSIASSNGKFSTFEQDNAGSKPKKTSLSHDEKDLLSRMKWNQPAESIARPSESKRVYDNSVRTVKFTNSSKNQSGVLAQSTVPEKWKSNKTGTKISPFFSPKQAQKLSGQLQSDDEDSVGTSGSEESDCPYGDESDQAWKVQEDMEDHHISSVKYRDKKIRFNRRYEERNDGEGLDSNDTSSERESSAKHNGGTTFRGQRSARRKHLTLDAAKSVANETESESEFKETSDGNWIIQKLGRDAIGKKVEVFRPRDRSWCRGKVTEVLSQQSRFIIRFEDGMSETLEFGRRTVRVLSHLGKHPRS